MHLPITICMDDIWMAKRCFQGVRWARLEGSTSLIGPVSIHWRQGPETLGRGSFGTANGTRGAGTAGAPPRTGGGRIRAHGLETGRGGVTKDGRLSRFGDFSFALLCAGIMLVGDELYIQHSPMIFKFAANGP